MAVQTKPYLRMSAEGVVILEVFMEYQDDDYQEINDDGDPDDFRLVRFYGTNYSAYPRTVEIRKGNGQMWQAHTIPAGESFSVNAGGAVKYESDIPDWRWA
ncbi:MAG: hypothetical protein ABFR89_02500 [Actinomycetota bacterium]